MRGVVFSGGGAYGAFQVGCCLAMVERETQEGRVPVVDLFNGISVGAINAAFLCQYPSFVTGVYDLQRLWEGLSRRRVWRFNPFKTFSSTGVLDSRPLKSLLKSVLSAERIHNSGHKLRVGVTNMMEGSYFEASEADPNIVDWVIASSSYPILFPTYEREGVHYSDGGIFSLTPLRAAIEAGCTTIDVFMADPLKTSPMAKPLKNALHAARRTVDIMLHTFWLNDLASCAKKNLRAKEGDPKYREISLRVWAPTNPLPYSSQAFDPKEMHDMLSLGKKTQPVSLDQFLRS